MEFTKKTMIHKKELPALIYRLKERGRRLCAMLLCMSMVMGGFPTSAFQAFATESIKEYFYEFELDYLYESFLMAIPEGTTLDTNLYFTGEYAKQYEELFDADGTLYELKDFEVKKDRDRDKVLDLRLFVRIEGDIPLDEVYRFDGNEEIIFLITNRSDEEVNTTICVDGRETDVIKVLPSSMIEIEDDTEKDSDIEEKNISKDSVTVSFERENTSGDEDTEIRRGYSSGIDSSAEKDEENQNDDIAESNKDNSPASSENKDDSGKEKSDDGLDIHDKDGGGEKSHERNNHSDGHERADNFEHSGNKVYDKNRRDKGSSDRSNDLAGHDMVSISVHKTGLLAASIETEDYKDANVAVRCIEEAAEKVANDSEESEREVKPATPSNTSPSDACYEINGIVYNPVRLENKGAAAFATTAEDLELTRYYGINALTAYDQIYIYMDSLLECSTELEEGDIEDAIDLWNELMDAWDAIYEAEDNEILNLNSKEYDNLDEITEEIYRNVVATGYDPYMIMTLDDYWVEVTGSIILDGGNGTWTQSSDDGGEVLINGNIITGWVPGTVTLTSGGMTHTVIVSSTIRVLVYVSSADVSDKMFELLGIGSGTVDVYGYFPAGVVYLDASYLIDNNLREVASTYDEALILTEEHWQEVLSDIYGMVTSESVFADGYKQNADNNVTGYLEDAADYLENGANSGGTGLFKTDGNHGYSDDYSDVLFHMDLLFHTNTVTYQYGHNGIQDGQGADDDTAIAEQTYIQGVTIDEADPIFTIPNGWVFEGYYTDYECTDHWDSSKRLYEDMTIYIKLAAGVDIFVDKEDADTEEFLEGAVFQLLKIVDEELYDEEGEPIEDKAPFVYYYDFNEYNGWISDPDQATPYTTSERGDFTMTLAGCEYDDITFCYVLKEIEAPEGYALLDEDVVFLVIHEPSDGINEGVRDVRIISTTDNDMVTLQDNTTIIIKNELEVYPVDIFKFTGEWDSDSLEDVTALADAEFVLSQVVTETNDTIGEGNEVTYYAVFDMTEESSEAYDGIIYYYSFEQWIDDPAEATILVSCADGFIHMVDLLPGSYYLTETKAPNGYLPFDEAIRFTIFVDSDTRIGYVTDDTVINAGVYKYYDYDGDIITLYIGNNFGYELPEAGGSGTLPFILMGLLLMSGSTFLYLVFRRRKARVGN